MHERIVIAEDDESIRRLLEVALQGNGYDPHGFDNAADALADMEQTAPDVAIFDIMMEGMDGLEAVRRVRESPALCAVPVILLTAKDTELDKILGLDAGADDYVTKPFSILELCARIRAQLRRHSAAASSAACYEAGPLRLDPNAHEATLDGQPLPLTLKEFQLLQLLMENRDRALSRTELLRLVWGTDYCGETRTLDMHIGTLRHKLGDGAEDSRFIKTVRGVGYRFIGGSQG